MGALREGYDWVGNTAGETGQGLSQIWGGLSKNTTFKQKELPIFAALLTGVIGFGLMKSVGFSDIKDFLNPSNLVGMAGEGAKMVVGAGALAFMAGTVAEWVKTGDFSKAVSNTATDFGDILNRWIPADKPATPNLDAPKGQTVTVQTAPPAGP